MDITSTAFGPGRPIPGEFTCDGAGLSPPLAFTDVPSGSRSLALIMDDPDAPMGLWVHWLVWNIPPGTSGLAPSARKPDLERAMEGHMLAGAGLIGTYERSR